MPLALGITTNYLMVDSPNLPGSANARFKVTATDQMNSWEDTSDASFTVGRKGPQAYILSPELYTTIQPGTPFFLQGYAYDLEDGILNDNSLRWSSDLDGDLGVGSTVIVSLSSGQHTVTLSATDRDGNSVSSVIHINVGYNIYLPITTR